MNSEKHLTQSIFWLAIITAGILLIPLIAMQLTGEIVWTLSDFIFTGSLIFGTGLTYKIVTKTSQTLVYRLAAGSALATGFLIIWVNGAVGIIGTETNPYNLVYYGVLFIGLTGTAISRLQPKGMASSMFITAFAQALITAIALIGGFYPSSPGMIFHILGVNGFFIALWIGSALMFRYASNSIGDPNKQAQYDS